uniref:DUF3231 family protein n=1 Tax=Heterorhabditis bacteriophora TaxID=37862 RepID=A0A1I7XLY4_HETBA
MQLFLNAWKSRLGGPIDSSMLLAETVQKVLDGHLDAIVPDSTASSTDTTNGTKKVMGLLSIWEANYITMNLNRMTIVYSQATPKSRLTTILRGEETIKHHMQFLIKNNHTDMLILKEMKDCVRTATAHNATLMANGIMHLGTTCDDFLRFKEILFSKYKNYEIYCFYGQILLSIT